MDESYDELIPDWCNEDLDVKCIEAVDEFEKKGRLARLSDTEMEEVLEDTYLKSTKRHKMGHKTIPLIYSKKKK